MADAPDDDVAIFKQHMADALAAEAARNTPAPAPAVASPASTAAAAPPPSTDPDVIQFKQHLADAQAAQQQADAAAAAATPAKPATPPDYTGWDTVRPPTPAPGVPTDTTGVADTLAPHLRQWLAPDPKMTYGSVWPVAYDKTTDAPHLAMPSSLRDLFQGGLDLVEGPATGTVTPAGTNALLAGATAGKLTPSVASGTGAAIAADTTQAPLSAAFRAHPLAAGAADRIAQPTLAPGATSPTPADILTPWAKTAPTTAPETSAAAKTIASAYYAKAQQDGGTLTPAFANKFVDAAQKIAPQSDAGAAVAGQTPVTALATRLEALRDQPISLQGAQEIDESLSGLIDKEYGMKGLSKDGKALFDLQSQFRNMIQDAGPDDVNGGTSGFDSLVQGRKAWSQAMKMDDLERIQQRAEMTDNPATGIKSGIRVLLNNRSRARGYSDDELDALKDAGNRGLIGGAFHVFGNRLMPLAAGVGGFFGSGAEGGVASAAAAQIGTTAAREAATWLQSRRLGAAMETLGKSVPPHPLQP